MNKAFFISLLFPLIAQAQTFEIEVDPTAYAFDGYSGHFIVDTDMGFRMDTGIFALTVPEAFESNDGFESKQSGIGFKLDYYGRRQDGLFVGVQYDFVNTKVREKESDESLKTSDSFVGVRLGYRWGINGFYISPWIVYQERVGDREDDTIGGKTYTYEKSRILPFVHLGYRF